MKIDALAQLIRRSIDMHVHIGPEVIPRKYTAAQLVADQSGALGGAVVKNHMYPTVLATAQLEAQDFIVIPGLVLNNFVGGLNPDAVYATSLIANGPFVVWLPTVHAAQFLANSAYEIAPEWVSDKTLTLRRAKDIVPVAVSKNGQLTLAAQQTIKAVAQAGAVLATGHISWQETELVADYAQRVGVQAVIVTHPIYQHIRMPIDAQRRLAARGCYMEQCYSMYSMDGISIADIVTEIRAVGPRYIVLSSDVGQTFSPPPNEALTLFCKLLMAEGITMEELEVMLVTNPRRILGISGKTTYNKALKARV